MPKSIDFTLTIANMPVTLRLFAEGALFWSTGKTLFITDPHFGKADSFRHAGIAIPTAILDHDLARLSKLLTITGASTLTILGDFFHTRHSQSKNVLSALATWRKHHPDLQISLILGNHDQHAGPPPVELGIEVMDAPLSIGPFVCHHLPQETAADAGYLLAGHLHPHVILHDYDGTSMRLAAFIFSPHQAILPAFGGFTGSSAYRPTTADRVVVISEGEIVEITRPQRFAKNRRLIDNDDCSA